jgi:hypothetical protein
MKMEASIKLKDYEAFVQAVRIIITEDGFHSTGIEPSIKESLEGVKSTLQASLTIVNGKLAEIIKQEIASTVVSTGDSLLCVENIQCFEPRGRFNVKVTTTSLLLEGKQSPVLIPAKYVSHIICLPSFTCAKKDGEDYVALLLTSPVKVNNKDSFQVLLNLNRSSNATAKSTYGNELSESAIFLLAIQEATGLTATRHQPALFSTIRDQKPYLKCYRGTQEGAIYPLKCGVLFIKPMLFIATDDIAALAAGRGGGANNTRYVDLQVW